jgi:hypothetical protein
MFDTLDTYFIFLRTRVMIGGLSGRQEEELVVAAREWLANRTAEIPALCNSTVGVIPVDLPSAAASG